MNAEDCQGTKVLSPMKVITHTPTLAITELPLETTRAQERSRFNIKKNVMHRECWTNK